MDASKRHRLWLLCIILSLITGLSYGLGGDKQTYIREFAYYPHSWNELSKQIELGVVTRGQMPGWVMLNMLVKNTCDSFIVVQLIEAFFVNIAVFYTCQRYTQRVFFFVLVYCINFTCLYFNTEVMREAFSIGFCLYASEAYFRKRHILAILCMVMAILFHVSALVFLLFPFMRFRVTRRRLPIMMVACLAVWVLSDAVFSKILAVLVGGEGALMTKMALYTSTKMPLSAFIVAMCIYLVFPFVIWHLGYAAGNNDEELMRRKMQFMTFYLCIGIVVPSFLSLARFLNYPLVVFLCITTDIIYTIFRKRNHFLTKVGCLFVVLGYAWYQYIAYMPNLNVRGYEIWFPYTSIFDSNKDRTRRIDIHEAAFKLESNPNNNREVK